jgi:hypothetical protein
VDITAASTVPGVTYQWSDNVILSDPSQPTVSVLASGDYSVTVTNPANGCSNNATVTVGMNTGEPNLSASVSNTLTCSNPTATLTARSDTLGVVFSWAGFAGDNPVTVSSPGTYTVTAQNPANGCTKIQNVKVLQDTIKPDLSVGASGTLLTCAVTSDTLTASSTTSGATLTWTGFATGKNPVVVSAPGTYYVTALRTSNGCTKVDSMVISQNNQVPDLTAQGGTITCTDQVVTITASSTAPVTYLWSDGGLLGDPTTSELLAFIAGDYSVTVTNTENGCTNSTTVTVGQDNSSPVCNIISDGSPAALSDNTVTAQETAGASYAWTISSAPGWSIVSGDQSPALTFQAGDAGTSDTVYLTVTSPNGCAPSNCNLPLTAVSSLKSSPALATIADTSARDLQARVYPNPFSEKAYIEFTPAESSRLTIGLYTANGTLQGRLFDNMVQAAQQYKVTVDGEALQPGIYYVIVNTNGKVYRYKLVLVN